MQLNRITWICSILNSCVVKSKLFKNSCVVIISDTPLYLKSIQSRYDVKFQYAQNDKISLKKCDLFSSNLWISWKFLRKYFIATKLYVVCSGVETARVTICSLIFRLKLSLFSIKNT